MVQENCVIVICGPTASGKSKIAIDLAKELDTEIISADSLAIYKYLDIGTAKPSKQEQLEVKHHLIDCVEPENNFSVDEYASMASPILNSLIKKGKNPIICGGTGYYIKSLLYDFSYGNCGSDENIREKYKKIAEEKGNLFLFENLKDVDYETSLKLYPNDLMRVIRALEIFELTGVKKSQIVDEAKPKYNFFAFMPNHERELLYDRINKRVDLMLENGLIDEVKSLIKKGIDLNNQCMQGIGYKEVFEALKNNTLDSVSEVIKQNTRRYAKRQITFFKKLDNLEYVSTNYKEEILAKINNN